MQKKLDVAVEVVPSRLGRIWSAILRPLACWGLLCLVAVPITFFMVGCASVNENLLKASEAFITQVKPIHRNLLIEKKKAEGRSDAQIEVYVKDMMEPFEAFETVVVESRKSLNISAKKGEGEGETDDK